MNYSAANGVFCQKKINALLSTTSMYNAIYNTKHFTCINKKQGKKERRYKILLTNIYLHIWWYKSSLTLTHLIKQKHLGNFELFFVKCLRWREHYYYHHPNAWCSIMFKIQHFKLLFYINCWFYSLFACLYKNMVFAINNSIIAIIIYHFYSLSVSCWSFPMIDRRSPRATSECAV